MNEESDVFEQSVMIADTPAIELQERALIDTQIATAHKYPRLFSKVKADMMSMATLDEETAASCFYVVPRGNKNISGPSVRLAEIAVSSYGNCRVATRIVGVESTGDAPHVVVQSAVHDLEKNVAVVIEKRRRITKKKSKNTVDEDDIQLAVNACSAIAFRDAVFKVIPGALIKNVYDAARKLAIGDAHSLAAKREVVVERLTKMGASTDRILARVNAAKIEDVDLDKLEVLIGLGTALKDGNVMLEDAFPAAPTMPEAGRAGFGFTTAAPQTADAGQKATVAADPAPAQAAAETAKPAVAAEADVDPETGQKIPPHILKSTPNLFDGTPPPPPPPAAK